MRLNSLLFFIILILTSLLIIGRDVYPADDSSGTDNNQTQIKQIQTDLSHEKEQFLEFDQKEKGLLDQLSAIEKEVNDKRMILRDLNEDIQTAQEELEKQREKLKSIEISYNQMKGLLNKRLGAFYKYARRGYLRVFTDANDLNQLNHMIKYLRVILDKDLMLIRQASSEHQDYKQQVSVVEKKIKTISDIKEEESNNISSLKAELEKKVILLSRVHKEKEFYETAVIELGSAAEGLKNTITDLDNRENKNNDKTTVLPSGFADLKGKLPLPVKGKIIKGNRQSGENIFNSLKGVYISGSFGADVKSIYQGRVDYSGQLKGYGQVVVINHGERFFTISAYLARRNKNEGDIVEKGEKIGQIGETGLLAGPALYFEMRKGDTNLDPLKWLKVD